MQLKKKNHVKNDCWTVQSKSKKKNRFWSKKLSRLHNQRVTSAQYNSKVFFIPKNNNF